MSDERCLPYREDLAAYALGALDIDEISSLEAHLADCADCQAELAGYQAVADGLLQSVPPRTPPLEVRRKLIAQLPSQQAQNPRRWAGIFSRLSFGQLALAVVVIFLLGLNIVSNLQIRALQQGQSELADRLSQDQTAIAMLSYPSTQALPVHADLENVAGSMLVDKDKRVAVLVLWNLPQVGPSQTYQIWLIDANGKRTSGGLFRPVTERGYTTATVLSPQPLGEFKGIGVTVEPAGGSQGPTGPRVLGVDL